MSVAIRLLYHAASARVNAARLKDARPSYRDCFLETQKVADLVCADPLVPVSSVAASELLFNRPTVTR